MRYFKELPQGKVVVVNLRRKNRDIKRHMLKMIGVELT